MSLSRPRSPFTADTKAADSRVLLEPGQQVYPLRSRSGRRRELNAYAVNPADKPASGADGPHRAQSYRSQKACVSPSTPFRAPIPTFSTIGLNDRDKAWHDLYRLKNLHRRAHAAAQEYRSRSRLDLRQQGTLRLAARAADNGDTENSPSGPGQIHQNLHVRRPRELPIQFGFDKDNKRVYLETNKGDNDLNRASLCSIPPPARLKQWSPIPRSMWISAASYSPISPMR